MKSSSTKTRSNSCILYLALCTILVIMLSACGSGTSDSDDSSSGMGSVIFSLKLEDGASVNTVRPAAEIDCDASGIATVEASVLSATDALLKSGGPWNCDLHRGEIQEVPIQNDCMVVVYGKDAGGQVTHRGESPRMDIHPGNNDAGEITLIPVGSSKWDEMIWDIDKWG